MIVPLTTAAPFGVRPSLRIGAVNCTSAEHVRGNSQLQPRSYADEPCRAPDRGSALLMHTTRNVSPPATGRSEIWCEGNRELRAVESPTSRRRRLTGSDACSRPERGRRDCGDASDTTTLEPATSNTELAVEASA